MVSGRRPEGPSDPTELRGRTLPWGWAGGLALALLVAIAAWLRLRGLSAEGFADDEVHKWIAANRYLAGAFGGDDLEHPMLMKSLVALLVAAFGTRLDPETLTRLPNVFAGALTVWATALLGRRLFGRAAALLGAGLVAVSTTVVGYHRIGKEDVLLGLFFTLSIWCLSEARAAAEDGRPAESRRWEWWSAAGLGAAFASKYFIFYFLIPVLAYLWLRPVSAWRVPPRRWAALVGVALLVFLALNWAVLDPATFAYLRRYVTGEQVGGDRGVSESILFMGRLYGNMPFDPGATPTWFFGAFAVAKWLPATVLLALTGIAVALWRRAPAHRVLLLWPFVFWLFSVIAGGKYGRFFVSVMPPFLLFAGHGAVVACRWIAGLARRAGAERARAQTAALAVTAAVVLLPEAATALARAPHNRLYVNALAGGEGAVHTFLPHCDYFDAGVREALRWVAARAPAGAELCSDVDWTVRLYAEEARRPDLVSEPLLPGRCCAAGRTCYVVVQAGRLYRHNEAAVAHLRSRRPDHVERIRGIDAVRVYELAAGERPFPTASGASASVR